MSEIEGVNGADATLLRDTESKATSGDVAAQVALAHRCLGDAQSDLAVQWFRKAASTGDPLAKAELGRYLLGHAQKAEERDEGIKAIVSASRSGRGEAAYLAATSAGSGLDMPQNWATALDYLQRSAELGYRKAQIDLARLSGHGDLEVLPTNSQPTPSDKWQRLRESIDLSIWLAQSRVQISNSRPQISVIKGFASHQVCDWMIEKAGASIPPADVLDPSTRERVFHSGRTNSASYCDVLEFDFPILFLRQRISTVTELPLTGFERTAILRYAMGQKYDPHFDFFDPETPGFQETLAEDGQRVATFLLYLNDDYEGGETDFVDVPWRRKGKKGDAVFWWNVQPSGEPDPMTLHGGRPPTLGEKWLLSQWIRLRPPSWRT